jgi:hypothetical protein
MPIEPKSFSNQAEEAKFLPFELPPVKYARVYPLFVPQPSKLRPFWDISDQKN